MLGFAVATTFAPFLRCLGAGYLYTYNLAFPAAALFGLVCAQLESGLTWAVWATTIAAGIGGIAYRWHGDRAREGDKTATPELLAFLNQAPKGVVMCLPYRLSDIIAYSTEHAVVWGGHGQGFKRLEPLFPRLLIPVSEACRSFGVTYLVIEGSAFPASFEAELAAFGEPRGFGDLRLFSLPARSPADRSPSADR